MSTRQITIGSDPELFLVDLSGKFISSIDKIGGSKDFPFDIENGCAVQEDNVAVEFNIPPCTSLEQFIDSCEYSLSFLTWKAQQAGLNLQIIPSATFDADQLEDPRAQAFGCDPDFNAWDNMRRNPRPRAASNLRSAGGHIHIGGVADMNIPLLVQALDKFIGVPMVLFDQDTRRRQLYGKAGACRVKPYGVEYRTVSNEWLASKRFQWIWEQTHKAVDFVDNGGVIDADEGKLIQVAINTSNVELAQQLSGA